METSRHTAAGLQTSSNETPTDLCLTSSIDMVCLRQIHYSAT